MNKITETKLLLMAYAIVSYLWAFFFGILEFCFIISYINWVYNIIFGILYLGFILMGTRSVNLLNRVRLYYTKRSK